MVHFMSNLTLLLIIGGLAHRCGTIRTADIYVQPAFGLVSDRLDRSVVALHTGSNAAE
jgi:hypothetical protein